ncbi:hypothetical protein EDC94DRAFT_591936 [Helicostylum pulchrum]|nr:hypothetical protein EDC94DRAFT_591936 [Helicostylum pulchrum]
MSDKTYPSSIDWKEASGKQSLSSTISIRIKTIQPTSTITYTDYVASTITASNYKPTVSNNGYEPTTYAEDVWEHRIHRFLPVILAFAIIGILTVLGCLVYLAYRFYQANRSSRRRRRRRRDAEEATNFEDENNKKTNAGSPISTTLSNIIPWLAIPSPLHPNDQDGTYVDYQQQQREPIRYEKSDLNRIMMEDSNSTTRRPSLAPSWLAKFFPNKFNNNNTERPQQKQRHLSLPILGERPTIDNLNVPISSTFKPIDNSFLTLVPRSEIWLDPNRRRGVDELDIWERKKSGTVVAVEEPTQPAPLMWRFPSETAYPSSPESFERRISAIISGDLIHSRPSSVTTVQETYNPYQASTSRHKSEVKKNQHFVYIYKPKILTWLFYFYFFFYISSRVMCKIMMIVLMIVQ